MNEKKKQKPQKERKKIFFYILFCILSIHDYFILLLERVGYTYTQKCVEFQRKNWWCSQGRKKVCNQRDRNNIIL